MAEEQVDISLPNDRANLSDDCLVLLEQVIRTNNNLVEQNQRLREEHELSAKAHADVQGSSSGWTIKPMLREILLREDSIVVDRPYELWYRLHVE